MNKQVVSKNLLISYVQIGDERGNKTLLFLHGWRSNAQAWRPVIFNFQFSIFNSIAMDLPGFGGSQVPAAPMTVGNYAEVMAEFIGKLNLKNIILVGHSFGGRVGIKLAAKYPEIIEKLVLVDSAGFAVSLGKKNIMAAAAKLVKPFFKPKLMQGLRKKIYQAIGAEDYVATPELQKTFVNIVAEDLTEDMKNIKVPTLIIFGENDKDTPPSTGQQMQSLIPNSHLVILKDAGHFSFLDQPEEFCKNLLGFTK